VALDYEHHVIEAPRLELHLVSPQQLLQLADGTFDAQTITDQGFSNPFQVLLNGPSPVRWRAPQVAKDVTLNRWFIRWIVVKETRQAIGSISFHAPPDDSGMIEVGLGIIPEFQNQGYGKEALRAFWRWAIQQPEVRILRYTVGSTNTSSVALITSFGFHHVGQQIDQEDGPEEIYEMSVEEFANRL